MQICFKSLIWKENDIKKKHYILMNEMKKLLDQMTHTENWFQTEDDADLIDACIYQKEALQAKYRYLLRLAKFHIGNDIKQAQLAVFRPNAVAQQNLPIEVQITSEKKDRSH